MLTTVQIAEAVEGFKDRGYTFQVCGEQFSARQPESPGVRFPVLPAGETAVLRQIVSVSRHKGEALLQDYFGTTADTAEQVAAEFAKFLDAMDAVFTAGPPTVQTVPTVPDLAPKDG